jgi:hypothetical protein
MEGLQKWRVGVRIWRSMENEGSYRGPAGVGFFLKPPNFGVEAHIETPTGVALIKYPDTKAIHLNKLTQLGKRLTARICTGTL